MNSRVDLDGKIIAIVDDHEAFVHSLGAFLEFHGAKVLAYSRVNEFLRQLPSADCVLIDYYMPDINGLALASELRSRAYGVPVILLTAMSGDVPENWAASGVSEVIDKLSVGKELLQLIHRHASVRAVPPVA